MHRLMPVVATVAAILITVPARADCGDQLFKLLADDGAMEDQFGRSVAISRQIAVVGGVRHDKNGTDSGSAYLFDIVTGRQIAELLPDDGMADDQFGYSVAISGSTVVVGAPHDGDNGTFSGSAYLFDANTGRQIAKLLPRDGARHEEFGTSVAIDGEIAIVGTPFDGDNGVNSGSVYVFDTGTGRQIAKLLSNDGGQGDLFGLSIEISGTTAIVGAFGNQDHGESYGAAYLFDATTGRQLFKLLPEDRRQGGGFGNSVAISGAIAIVGAANADRNGRSSGSAYLFDVPTGRQMVMLLPRDGGALDRFGYSVAIARGAAIVGAHNNDDNGPDSGSAYLFDTTTGEQIIKLLPDDNAESDFFGISVAISGSTAIVGAWGDDDNGVNSGSAQLFDLTGCTICVRDPGWLCDGDVNGNGQVNPVDLGLVQAAFGSLDDQDLCNYDLDCNGQINPADAGIVQSLFGTCEEAREMCP